MMRPWGDIDWLLPQIGEKPWSSIVCASFEQRCVAVPQLIAGSVSPSPTHYLLRVNDPENRYSKQCKTLIDDHEKKIFKLLGSSTKRFENNLLDEPTAWYQIAREAAIADASILLDISTMPKRVFLFITKILLSSPNVKDLVICYTRAESYPEGLLTEDAEPPAAIPGFLRNDPGGGESTVIVGVGYMAFNLGELLEQARGKSLKFLFPFPPGSPAFRRNWRLLHELVPTIDIQTEIQRIHSMDMFAVVDWLNSVRRDSQGLIDLIPLGPKPHTLAMGLAYLKMDSRAELLYSQPHVYRPDYSIGIKKKSNGRPDILAYCLRRDFVDYI